MSSLKFDKIAKRYDLINQVVSFGLVNLWRKWFCRSIIKSVDINSFTNNSIQYCDYACGTGAITKKVSNILLRKKITFEEIRGRDISDGMLDIAKRRKYKADIVFESYDAMLTPVGNEMNKFDLITCAFGLRNFIDPVKGVHNFAKSLKNGGFVAVLEFSKPRILVNPFILFYYYFVLWRIAWVLGGDIKMYRYLGRSITRWYKPDSLSYVFESTEGLKKVLVKRSLFGIVALHIFRKVDSNNLSQKPLRTVNDIKGGNK